MVKSWLRFVFALSVVVSVSSCSFRRIAIERADWLIMMQLDSCFDLTWAQERALKPEIAELLMITRKNSLPKIALWMRQAAAEIVKPYDEGAFRKLFAEAWTLRSDLMLDGVPFAAKNLKTVSQEQLTHCQTEQYDKDKKIRKLLEEDAESYPKAFGKKVIKSHIDFVSGLFGTLSEDQEKLLGEINYLSKDQLQVMLATKGTYQTAFFGQIAQKSPIDLRTAMPLWIHDSQTMLHPGQAPQDVVAWHEVFITKVSKFLPTLTATQKQHFQMELLALAQDLEKM